jgi:hypothetical protein
MLLTGQSDPASCDLSPAQRAFLEALPLPAADKVLLNFPYAEDTAAWRPTWLPLASVRHVRQFTASRQPVFVSRHRAPVRARIERAERTLILAGSLGLELLLNLQLARETLDRLHVFAYGPVARGRPDCDCILVQGRGDWISRLWFPAVDHRVDCGHLDYLESPDVLRLCVDVVRRLVGVEREVRA